MKLHGLKLHMFNKLKTKLQQSAIKTGFFIDFSK